MVYQFQDPERHFHDASCMWESEYLSIANPQELQFRLSQVLQTAMEKNEHNQKVKTKKILIAMNELVHERIKAYALQHKTKVINQEI